MARKKNMAGKNATAGTYTSPEDQLTILKRLLSLDDGQFAIEDDDTDEVVHTELAEPISFDRFITLNDRMPIRPQVKKLAKLHNLYQEVKDEATSSLKLIEEYLHFSTAARIKIAALNPLSDTEHDRRKMETQKADKLTLARVRLVAKNSEMLTLLGYVRRLVAIGNPRATPRVLANFEKIFQTHGQLTEVEIFVLCKAFRLYRPDVELYWRKKNQNLRVFAAEMSKQCWNNRTLRRGKYVYELPMSSM